MSTCNSNTDRINLCKETTKWAESLTSCTSQVAGDDFSRGQATQGAGMLLKTFWHYEEFCLCYADVCPVG